MRIAAALYALLFLAKRDRISSSSVKDDRRSKQLKEAESLYKLLGADKSLAHAYAVLDRNEREN